MPFLIAAKIFIHSKQSEKKVIISLNDCMVEIDSKRQFVVTHLFIYINFAETKVGGWRWVTSRPLWPATGP